MERLTGISVFVEVVESGSFSAAAELLHLSRSAVGKTIAKLEERLGVRLFHRTTRTQSLTNEGQAYYEYCRRALAELRAGEEVLESGRQRVAGKLRVAMPVLFGRYCAAPVLTELAQQHQGLELELAFSDRNVDLLADGFDLAVRSGRPASGDGLMVRRIAEQNMYLCASPTYLAQRGTPTSIPDLEMHEALAYTRAGRPRTWLFPQPHEKPVEVMPNARLCFDDLDAIADATAKGMGLAWLPCWLIRERVQRGELVRLLTNRPAFGFGIYALWPQTPHLPCRLRVAIDALAELLPKLVNVE